MTPENESRPAWERTADIAITIIIWVLVAYVIVSWIPALRNGRVGTILDTIMGPILAPVRMVIPPVGGLDLSVLVYFFGLRFVQRRFLRR
jgi:YggT family protein